MKPELFDIEDAHNAGCPGCGNFSYSRVNLKIVLADIEIDPL